MIVPENIHKIILMIKVNSQLPWHKTLLTIWWTAIKIVPWRKLKTYKKLFRRIIISCDNLHCLVVSTICVIYIDKTLPIGNENIVWMPEWLAPSSRGLRRACYSILIYFCFCVTRMLYMTRVQQLKLIV